MQWCGKNSHNESVGRIQMMRQNQQLITFMYATLKICF